MAHQHKVGDSQVVVCIYLCVDDHDVFAFLTHSLSPATAAVSTALHYCWF